MAAPAAQVIPAPDAPNDPSVEAAYAAVPDTMIAEILDGVLHTQPRPARRHAKASSRLLVALGARFWGNGGGPGGWVFFHEPELHLGRKPDKLAPDLAGWHEDRLPEDLGEDEDPASITIAPDWVCEVLSPRTEATDRIKKMHIYRREGVRHVWLIQPRARVLEVYRHERDRFVLLDTFGGSDVVRAEPFDAVELDLQPLWIGSQPPDPE